MEAKGCGSPHVEFIWSSINLGSGSYWLRLAFTTLSRQRCCILTLSVDQCAAHVLNITVPQFITDRASGHSNATMLHSTRDKWHSCRTQSRSIVHEHMEPPPAASSHPVFVPRNVFCSSKATVIGRTPPGNSVNWQATSAASRCVTLATNDSYICSQPPTAEKKY